MRTSSVEYAVGERIAGTAYRVRAKIGSGGMGSVYEVEHCELGRVFVLKALHGHLSSRSDLVARMRNEWRALGRLNHPNIVQVTDAGQTASGLPFFVMESLSGKTLGQLIFERGRLSLRQACRVMLDVLAGLGAAHATGAIHRDVKPPNIFVVDHGTTKLLDFGIAKLRDQAARVVTAGGVSVGTPRYMAPEQAAGAKVDARADIYAVGLVLYELLVGRSPFAHITDPNELVMAHIVTEPERADFAQPSIPAEMADLLQRWLDKSPGARPHSAELAARELRAIYESLPEDNQEDTLELPFAGASDAPTLGGAELEPAIAGSSQLAPALAGGEKRAQSIKVSPKQPMIAATLTHAEPGLPPVKSPAQQRSAYDSSRAGPLRQSTPSPSSLDLNRLGGPMGTRKFATKGAGRGERGGDFADKGLLGGKWWLAILLIVSFVSAWMVVSYSRTGNMTLADEQVTGGARSPDDSDFQTEALAGASAPPNGSALTPPPPSPEVVEASIPSPPPQAKEEDKKSAEKSPVAPPPKPVQIPKAVAQPAAPKQRPSRAKTPTTSLPSTPTEGNLPDSGLW